MEEKIICFLLPSFLPSFDGFLTLLLTFAVRRSFAGMFELEMLECEMPFAVLVRSAPARVSESVGSRHGEETTMGCDPFA